MVQAQVKPEKELDMEIRVGRVTHYFSRLGVAALEMTGEINIGDHIHFLGHTTDFEQVVSSLEIRHRKMQRVCPGQDVAIRTTEVVRKGDAVYVEIEAHEIGVEAMGL